MTWEAIKMKNTRFSIITRSASALIILAVLVLFVSAPLAAKGFRPNDRDDDNKKDNDRKETTATQTRSERSESHQSNESHSSAPRENSWRPGPSEQHSWTPPPVTTTTQPTTTTTNAHRFDGNGGDNRNGNRNDGNGNNNGYRPPSTPEIRVERPPDPAPVSTYRPHNDNNSGNGHGASNSGNGERGGNGSSGAFRPGGGGANNNTIDPPKPVTSYKPNNGTVRNHESVDNGYRPNTNTNTYTNRSHETHSSGGSNTDINRSGTFRPGTDTRHDYGIKPGGGTTEVRRPDSLEGNNGYRPDTGSNRNGDRDNRDNRDSNRSNNGGTTYRRDNGGNDRDRNRDNNNLVNRRGGSRPNFDLSYRTRGATITYRPSSNTSYRLRLGTGYYRPATVNVDHDRVWAHYAPRDYRPAGFSHGRYYYPRHIHHRHYDRPHYFGFWVFDLFPRFSVRSCYYHYGYYPYVEVTRVYETSYPEVIYVGGPVYTRGDYYLQDYRYKDLDLALGDIRSSWISSRYDLLERHVMPNDKIAIFLDGEYDYSIDGSDYLAMTRDALEELQTTSFVWDKVRRRDDNTVTAFGTHRFYGESGEVKTVYVSYTLDKIGGNYYVVEVGSSDSVQY